MQCVHVSMMLINSATDCLWSHFTIYQTSEKHMPNINNYKSVTKFIFEMSSLYQSRLVIKPFHKNFKLACNLLRCFRVRLTPDTSDDMDEDPTSNALWYRWTLNDASQTVVIPLPNDVWDGIFRSRPSVRQLRTYYHTGKTKFSVGYIAQAVVSLSVCHCVTQFSQRPGAGFQPNLVGWIRLAPSWILDLVQMGSLGQI